MTREEKTVQIQTLKDKFSSSQFFYITDSSTLSVEKINQFRRLCFEKGIEMHVVKNTLAKKALQGLENDSVYAPIYKSLVGPTSILFTDNAKAPANLLEEFRKTNEDDLNVIDVENKAFECFGAFALKCNEIQMRKYMLALVNWSEKTEKNNEFLFYRKILLLEIVKFNFFH